MKLEGLMGTYGYWAILVGTFLEGETILILGRFATSRGYLALPFVARKLLPEGTILKGRMGGLPAQRRTD